jgi:hypothetical protein
LRTNPLVRLPDIVYISSAKRCSTSLNTGRGKIS